MTTQLLAIGILAAISLSAQAQTPHHSRKTSACCSIVEAALRDAAQIKPGMKRADLAKMFTPESSPDFLVETLYFWKRCHYIKIRVSFILLDPQGNKESPSDIVKFVSGPHIQSSDLD